MNSTMTAKREAGYSGSVWMVVGGAGYIGSHVVRELTAHGSPCVVLDDLSTGMRESVPQTVELIVGDASDPTVVRDAVHQYDVNGVVHLAARKMARESRRRPLDYWSTNVGTMLGVLNGVAGTSVRRFILSSSCSIFGSAGQVDEQQQPRPQSPYARTKLVSEWILEDFALQYPISWTALRYFNVIGNSDFPSSVDRCGECIVPAAARRIRTGKQPEIFGSTFDTPDGTALRDYVDVRDLAVAHRLVADSLVAPGTAVAGQHLNVGTGSPTSVQYVLDELATRLEWKGGFLRRERAAADPDRIWAVPSPILHALGWSPRYSVSESIAAFCDASSRDD